MCVSGVGSKLIEKSMRSDRLSASVRARVRPEVEAPWVRWVWNAGQEDKFRVVWSKIGRKGSNILITVVWRDVG